MTFLVIKDSADAPVDTQAIERAARARLDDTIAKPT
jgi:hypothetical protein